MFTFLVILILIVASLLILLVLLQSSKKEGLGSPLGDIGATQLIGVQKAGDLLEQITWGLIIALFVFTLSTSLFLNKKTTLPTSPNIDRAQEHGVLPSIPSEASSETPATPDKEAITK